MLHQLLAAPVDVMRTYRALVRRTSMVVSWPTPSPVASERHFEPSSLTLSSQVRA